MKGKSYVGKVHQAKSNHRRSPQRPCTCEGHLTNTEKTSLHNHLLPGEEFIPKPSFLYQHKLVIQPPLARPATFIEHNHQKYLFDGFDILAHAKIDIPPLKFEQCGISYVVTLEFTKVGEARNYQIPSLGLFYELIFLSVLGFSDWLRPSFRDSPSHEHGAPRYYVYPRFVSKDERNQEEYFLSPEKIFKYFDYPKESVSTYVYKFGNNGSTFMKLHNFLEGQIVKVKKGKYIRIDGIDFAEVESSSDNEFFDTDRKPNDRKYDKLVRDLSQPTVYHKNFFYSCFAPVFRQMERKGKFQLSKFLKKNQYYPKFQFYSPGLCETTGLHSDVCEVAIVVPYLIYQIRLYTSLSSFEKKIGVTLSEKSMWKQALVHPSTWSIYESVAAEVRDALAAVGIRKAIEPEPKQDNADEWYVHTILTHFPQLCNGNTLSHIDWEIFNLLSANQRLEFLGDAVLEFITSTHIYNLLEEMQEGEMTIIRAGLVSNKLLSAFAEELSLHKYTIHQYNVLMDDTKEFASVMGDVYESLLGTIYTDQGIDAVRYFVANSMFSAPCDLPEEEMQILKWLKGVWLQPRTHPLQIGRTDRHLIKGSATYEKFTQLENSTGIIFRNIRLLAKAFTHPSMVNDIDLVNVGNNKRMEFLGDAILEFIVSRYLYARFSGCLEGQLTLLRNTLVNNDTLGEVAAELGFGKYIRYLSSEPLIKDGTGHANMLADTFEAYIAAVYLDRGIACTHTFLSLTLLSRLDSIIVLRGWRDPKTKLQYHINRAAPHYRQRSYLKYVTEADEGPPHQKKFTVGIYFRGQKIAEGKGPTKTAAEQDAANEAIRVYEEEPTEDTQYNIKEEGRENTVREKRAIRRNNSGKFEKTRNGRPDRRENDSSRNSGKSEFRTRNFRKSEGRPRDDDLRRNLPKDRMKRDDLRRDRKFDDRRDFSENRKLEDRRDFERDDRRDFMSENRKRDDRREMSENRKRNLSESRKLEDRRDFSDDRKRSEDRKRDDRRDSISENRKRDDRRDSGKIERDDRRDFSSENRKWDDRRDLSENRKRDENLRDLTDDRKRDLTDDRKRDLTDDRKRDLTEDKKLDLTGKRKREPDSPNEQEITKKSKGNQKTGKQGDLSRNRILLDYSDLVEELNPFEKFRNSDDREHDERERDERERDERKRDERECDERERDECERDEREHDERERDEHERDEHERNKCKRDERERDDREHDDREHNDHERDDRKRDDRERDDRERNDHERNNREHNDHEHNDHERNDHDRECDNCEHNECDSDGGPDSDEMELCGGSDTEVKSKGLIQEAQMG